MGVKNNIIENFTKYLKFLEINSRYYHLSSSMSFEIVGSSEGVELSEGFKLAQPCTRFLPRN